MVIRVENTKKRTGKRKRLYRSKRYQLLMTCAFMVLLIGATSTYAWYTRQEYHVESVPHEVMKPYYLTLLNPSETDALQLSVGNLFPGEVKQIVFCVSNQNNEANTELEMGVTSFDYTIELIHTENLALNYRIYELQQLDNPDVNNLPPGTITTVDSITVDDVETEEVRYWQKASQTPLGGTVVSNTRHTQVGLTEPKPVNAGKYTTFKQDSSGSALHLEAGTDAGGNNKFDSKFFVMEIDWQDIVSFESYRKETDMIYLLVQALQPKPEKAD